MLEIFNYIALLNKLFFFKEQIDLLILLKDWLLLSESPFFMHLIEVYLGLFSSGTGIRNICSVHVLNLFYV